MILCRRCCRWFGEVEYRDHREDCEQLVPPQRICVGIDPGKRVSGIALWGGNGGKYFTSTSAALERTTEAEAVRLLDALLGPEAHWVAAIEKPPPIKAGPRSPPTFAVTFWRRVVLQLAAMRYARWGLKDRGVTILMPMPAKWRKPIGIPARGVGETTAQRSAWLKQKALEWCRRMRIDVEVADVAEAIGVAAWLARASIFPQATKKGLVPIRWAP